MDKNFDKIEMILTFNTALLSFIAGKVLNNTDIVMLRNNFISVLEERYPKQDVKKFVDGFFSEALGDKNGI